MFHVLLFEANTNVDPSAAPVYSTLDRVEYKKTIPGALRALRLTTAMPMPNARIGIDIFDGDHALPNYHSPMAKGLIVTAYGWTVPEAIATAKEMGRKR